MMTHFQLIPGAYDPYWERWSLLQAALYYAKVLQLPVFPLSGKVPYKGTRGFYDATTDEEQIIDWWTEEYQGANIGIPTGARTGILILDIDKDHGGMASLEAIQQRYGPLEATRTVMTGTGGFHFWFVYPQGHDLRNRTQLRKRPSGSSAQDEGEEVYPGVDIRGTGGYITAPNSRHPVTGMRYRWLSEHKQAPCPAWIISLYTPPSPRPAKAQVVFDGARNTVSHDKRSPTYWFQVARTIAHKHGAAGNRNSLGFWLAKRMYEAGVHEIQAETIMREYADEVSFGDHAYTWDEALRSLKSAYGSL